MKTPSPKKPRYTLKKTATAEDIAAARVPWYGQPLMLGILLFILAIIAHGVSIKAGFIWDDDDYVTMNETLRTAGGLLDIWFNVSATPQYYPMVHTSYWLEYRIWELWAPGFHAVNVLLHAVTSALLYVMLRRLKVPGAWLGAALFAVHPVHVESVAWITERKNVLSGLFYVLAAWAYMASSPAFWATHRRWKVYGLSLALFAAALLSKTVTCTLPVALLIILWWKHVRVDGREVKLLAPHFLLGLVLGLLTVLLEKTQVGAGDTGEVLSLFDRLLIAGRAPLFYLEKLIFPAPLMFVYPRWRLDPTQFAQWIPHVALIALAIWIASRVREGHRGLAAAALFFIATLFPALGFFDVYPFRYSFVADHFQYLASLGVLVPVGAGAALLRRRAGRMPVTLVSGAVLVVLVGLSWKQSLIYKSQEALWTDTLAKNPNSDLALINLANLYTERGSHDRAIALYQRALKLNPKDDFAHYNTGVNLQRQGQFEDALTHYKEAIKIQPRYTQAWFNAGKTLEAMGRHTETEPYYRKALEIAPTFTQARASLATLLALSGKVQDAALEYQEAIKHDPRDPLIRFNYANILLQLGQKEQAADQYRETIKLDPQDAEAHKELGILLLDLGQKAEAAHVFENLLALRPGWPEATQGLEAARR